MLLALVLSVVLVAVFLGLSHMAVTVPLADFRAVTTGLLVFAVLLALAAPPVGLVLGAAVLAARPLARVQVPDTLPAWLQPQR